MFFPPPGDSYYDRTTALSRFVGAPFYDVNEVAPPLPNCTAVSPAGAGQIIPPQTSHKPERYRSN